MSVFKLSSAWTMDDESSGRGWTATGGSRGGEPVFGEIGVPAEGWGFGGASRKGSPCLGLFRSEEGVDGVV